MSNPIDVFEKHPVLWATEDKFHHGKHAWNEMASVFKLLWGKNAKFLSPSTDECSVQNIPERWKQTKFMHQRRLSAWL